jgi:PmbA protein
MTLQATGEQVLADARRGKAALQAETFLVASDHKTQEWSEGAPENEVVARSQGIGLRLIDEGRLGFSHSNRFDSEGLQTLLEGAMAGSQSSSPDKFLELPALASGAAATDLDLFDASMAAGWEKRCAFLETLETKVKARDPRLTKVLRASYTEARSEALVLNTRGVSAAYQGTSASFSLACVAVDKGETQIGYGFQAARYAGDLKIDWVINHTIESTLALLGGKQVPSGKYDLVLDPLIAAEMIELIAHAVRADQVQKGKSFLANRVGQAIGAKCLTFIDNGRLKRGLGSSPFDAEGVPTQTTTVVREGVLQGFLFDHYTARRGDRASTGNAGRGSYKGVPEPDTTNFYLEPGAKSPEAIIKEIRSGLYIRNVMGLHTVDTISGDFSLGIMGERIENGERTHGVRGVTIAGNLLDLMGHAQAAGSDLTFFGSVGSPTLWIRDVSVGGMS